MSMKILNASLDDFNGAILGSGLGATLDGLTQKTVALATLFHTYMSHSLTFANESFTTTLFVSDNFDKVQEHTSCYK